MTDAELLKQFQLLIQGMAGMENRLKAEIKKEIKESETRTRVFVENTVTKRIDALFDGYKLTHEKQWELERQNERMQEQIAGLQARMAALENRIA